MANELRIRQNFIGGLIEDNPLTAAATLLTSGGLASVVVIGTTQHFSIILDPDGLYGEPEVVWVTAHAAGASTATILRGQEGTTAREHSRDVPWLHGATVYDMDPPLPRVRAHASGNGATGAIPNDTYTPIPLAAESYDTHGFHDTATNNTRITIPAGLGGLYELIAQIEFLYTTTTGRRICAIRKNGASMLVTMQFNAYSGVGSTFVPATVTEPLAAGDYIELMGFTEPAGTWGGTVPTATWLIATRIGA